MKLIPTSSQTVGPFFSIGLAPLCQNEETALAATPTSITLQGIVLDGDKVPIPDCVLEFFAPDFFARVATSADGQYRVTIPPAASVCEVLVFMRGLLKPTLTRVYLCDDAGKNDIALSAVPKERIATLFACSAGRANHYEWNLQMQGDKETVFFEV